MKGKRKCDSCGRTEDKKYTAYMGAWRGTEVARLKSEEGKLLCQWCRYWKSKGRDFPYYPYAVV